MKIRERRGERRKGRGGRGRRRRKGLLPDMEQGEAGPGRYERETRVRLPD